MTTTKFEFWSPPKLFVLNYPHVSFLDTDSSYCSCHIRHLQLDLGGSGVIGEGEYFHLAQVQYTIIFRYLHKCAFMQWWNAYVVCSLHYKLGYFRQTQWFIGVI